MEHQTSVGCKWNKVEEAVRGHFFTELLQECPTGPDQIREAKAVWTEKSRLSSVIGLIEFLFPIGNLPPPTCYSQALQNGGSCDRGVVPSIGHCWTAQPCWCRVIKQCEMSTFFTEFSPFRKRMEIFLSRSQQLMIKLNAKFQWALLQLSLSLIWGWIDSGSRRLSDNSFKKYLYPWYRRTIHMHELDLSCSENLLCIIKIKKLPPEYPPIPILKSHSTSCFIITLECWYVCPL